MQEEALAVTVENRGVAVGRSLSCGAASLSDP
jgi:hypothetical protein